LGVDPMLLAVAWRGYDQWMWIEQNGQRRGASHLKIASTVETSLDAESHQELPEYQLSSRTRIKLKMLGMELPFDLKALVQMNSRFELKEMQARLQSPLGVMRLDAFTEARSLFYHVVLQEAQPDGGQSFPSPVSQPGREVCGRTPLSGPIMLNDVIVPILTRVETLEVGERWTAEVADPLKGVFDTEMEVVVEARETIEVDGEPIETWRLSERIGSLRSTTWYDDMGRVARRDLGNGMRMTRTDMVSAVQADPGFRTHVTFETIDREKIRQRVDPELDGTPLTQLLPSGLPRM
jgi:hypothetical protein